MSHPGNWKPRKIALEQERAATKAARYSPRHLLATGGQAVVVCRDCHRFRFLDLRTMRQGTDLRFARFRCECCSTAAVVGIARGVGDPNPVKAQVP